MKESSRYPLRLKSLEGKTGVLFECLEGLAAVFWEGGMDGGFSQSSSSNVGTMHSVCHTDT